MKHGLVTKDVDGEILLTDLGREKAIQVRSRNLVIQGFLTEVFGVDK